MTYFGLHAGPQMCSMAELRRVWQAADGLGFDWISIWDHFYGNPRGFEEDCFEAVASHAALAAYTERVRVGSLVYSAGYRHPAVLANAMVTIDHISDGRLELGIGAGWHKPEYDAYGIDFEPPGVRLRRLAESVEVVRLLWTEEEADFEGEFYTLHRARCHPKPVQKQPRIWIGASGDRALELAGRIGDAWNTASVSPQEFARRYDIVRRASDHPDDFPAGVNLVFLGSQPDGLEAALRRRLFSPDAPQLLDNLLLADDMDAVGQRVREYVDAGAQWIILNQRAPFDIDALTRFAEEVIPAFRPSTSATSNH
jgi:alkanesulfonate monooxygenase SsuD/methylene tetrahydromethanopterin reductase-like flavin-dependent oxidoreductase (luciferase family)